MIYRVLVRREVIEEAYIEVKTHGRVQAMMEAQNQAKANKSIAWHSTDVLNKAPYAVSYMKKG
jgi:hypothetical protein